ncbi:serine/threonine-protein phosphatase 6 regulatory subunit 3 isoform X3 [Palaemon carinicauda]|uniref:serine/threonine-protein phosphatase 6 regulatory subunit 3 isoform X3 n=1 Tax=Palaemon carinicauda TaxID=392227 RepID=UPI0035B5A2C3
MFWKYNFGSSAHIETLLQKDDVTLYELMDEAELLQECKAQNKNLIDFLTKAEILDELVCLVVNEPAVDGELQMRFKYANLAAELLTADVPVIINKLVASANLLDILYKFLEKTKPLNPLLASFFSKVLGMLVQRRSEQNWYSYQFTCFQVLDFLKSKGDFVDLAVRHVGTSAIMDLLLRLICNLEEDEFRQVVHQWLNDSQLVERLVDRLSPDADPEEHSSADNLLCEISTSCRDVGSDSIQTNPLLLSLESEETINKLLDLLLHEERSESSLSHVINVLLTLLSPKSSLQLINCQPASQQQQQQQQGLQQSTSVESSDSDSSEGRKNVVARTIAKRLPSLHNILVHPPKKGLLLTAYGQEVEPLGSTRLQVVTLVAALVAANDPIVHNALYELNTIDHLLDLFFKYSLNNFLHTQVEMCLIAILTKAPIASTPPSDTEHHLLTQLFTEGRIIDRILSAYEDTNESSECKTHNVKGYMGHLRQIANTIVQQAEFGPNEHRIKQLIQDLPGGKATQWDDFVSNTLAEVNRKNEITPLPVLGAHRHPDSDDDSDEDSNFFPQTVDSLIAKQWPHMHICNSVGGAEHVWGLTEVDDGEQEQGHCSDGKEEEEDSVLVKEITNEETEKGFKEMDMDVIGEFRYADEEFKDPDDNLSGPLQRLSTQGLSVSGVQGVGNNTAQAGIDGGGEGGVSENLTLFEEMCASRSHELHELADIWNIKEKEITFSQDSVKEESSKDKEGGSSSEEEEEDTPAFRPPETKMDVDDWAEVFDRRSSLEKAESDEPVNPWQSAPVADTSDNTGWADFGAFPSGAGNSAFANPFQKADKDNLDTFSADLGSNFGIASQENSSNAVFGDTTSSNEGFKADFSSVNFDQFGTNCEESKSVTDGVDLPNSEVPPDESNAEEESSEPGKDEDLMDNFNFLSSRGLLKTSESVDVQKGEDTGLSQVDADMEGQQNSDASAQPKS